MKRTFVYFCSVLFTSCLLVGSPAQANDVFSAPYVENPLLEFRLAPRSPEQVAAFYEGRGFPKAALERLKQVCFFTASVRNKTDDIIIWLEQRNWQFASPDGNLIRLDRAYWADQWDEMGLAQRHQATFRWTLLPETRDLRPGESIGGNIILPKTGAAFSLEAHFLTGAKKRGSAILAKFEDLECALNGGVQ